MLFLLFQLILTAGFLLSSPRSVLNSDKTHVRCIHHVHRTWFTPLAYRLFTKKKCYYKSFKRRGKSNLYSHDLFWLYLQQSFLTVPLTAFQITQLESKIYQVSSSTSWSNYSKFLFELHPTNHFEYLLHFKGVHSPRARSTAILVLSLEHLRGFTEDSPRAGAALRQPLCRHNETWLLQTSSLSLQQMIGWLF